MRKAYLLLVLLAFIISLSMWADGGKVCPVKDGSVQAEVTNSPAPKRISGTSVWEYEVTFVLMNSSPNFVNATYEVVDENGNKCSHGRVLVAPQKETEKKVTVKTRSNKSTFVVDVIGADCKESN